MVFILLLFNPLTMSVFFSSCCCKNGLNDFLFVYLCDFRVGCFFYYYYYFKFSLKSVVENIISLDAKSFSTQLLSALCVVCMSVFSAAMTLVCILLRRLHFSRVFCRGCCFCLFVIDFMCMILNVQSPLKSVTCHLVVSVVHAACHRLPVSCVPFACQYSNISTTKWGIAQCIAHGINGWIDVAQCIKEIP